VTRIRFLVAAALAAAVVLAASGGPASAGTSTCVVQYRDFYVSAADLTETVNAHWDYFDVDGHRATVDGTQTGVMSYRSHEVPAVADLLKGHQVASFQELQHGCRIPDYNQGFFYATAPMKYTLAATWTNQNGSGPCSGEKTSDRILRGRFTRKSLDWRYPKVGWRWELPGPDFPRCQIEAANDDGTVTRTLKEPWQISYGPGPEKIFTKRKLLNGKTLTIPLHLSAKRTRGGVVARFELTGSITLKRFHGCATHPNETIAQGRRCWDPRYW
jgi:hypothetical protein